MVGIVRLKRHALDPPTRTFATECPLHQKRRHQAFHRVPRSDGTIEDVRRSSSQLSSDTSREQSQFQRRSTEETSKRHIGRVHTLSSHFLRRFVIAGFTVVPRDFSNYSVIRNDRRTKETSSASNCWIISEVIDFHSAFISIRDYSTWKFSEFCDTGNKYINNGDRRGCHDADGRCHRRRYSTCATRAPGGWSASRTNHPDGHNDYEKIWRKPTG